VKLLKPDYEKICRTIIPEDYFSFSSAQEAGPDVHSLVSDTTLVLRSHRIPLVWKKAGEPFYYGRFLTECSADIKKWEIKVVNSRGKKIIKYKGTGKVPVQIDLKEDDITKFHAGEPYSPVMILISASGGKYSFYGDAFSFDVLVSRNKNYMFVELDSGKLFDSRNLLSEKGEDIISALQPVFAETREPALEIRTLTAKKKISETRTRNLIEALKKEFLIPAKNIKAELHIYSKIDFPSMELVIRESKPAKKN